MPPTAWTRKTMVYNDCIRAIIPWINRRLIPKSLDLGGKPKLVELSQLQPVLGYRPRPNDLEISHGALPKRVKKAVGLDACVTVGNTNANPNESGRCLCKWRATCITRLSPRSANSVRCTSMLASFDLNSCQVLHCMATWDLLGLG